MFKWLVDSVDDFWLRHFITKSQSRFFRPKARARYRSRLVWYVRQLFPLTYWSTYYGPVEGKYFAIWKMWFGRCYRVTDFQVADDTANKAVKCASAYGTSKQTAPKEFVRKSLPIRRDHE